MTTTTESDFAIILDTVKDDPNVFRPNANTDRTDLDRTDLDRTDLDLDLNLNLNIETGKNITHIKEVESLRSIIDRLDEVDKDREQNLDGSAENSNSIVATMRVDMVAIIKLLQTLHSNITEMNGETDNIKSDIFNLVTVVSRLKDKLNEINDGMIKRHQKTASKTEEQIAKLCSRVDVLERSNFSTTETKLKVKPKSKPEIVENNSLEQPNIVPRSAVRANQFDDQISKETIKSDRMAKRGLKDTIGKKKTVKPRNDMIKSIKSIKSSPPAP